MIRWKVCRKDWHRSGKRPEIGLCRKISNLYKVSTVFNVCLQNKLIIISSIAKNFCYRGTIRLKQEKLSCNNKTKYTRRHKFITHKNNCCQVFSRSRNDKTKFVNECKWWQSSSLKKTFSGFHQAKRKHLFSKSKPYSTTSHEHVSILTLGELQYSFTFVSALVFIHR